MLKRGVNSDARVRSSCSTSGTPCVAHEKISSDSAFHMNCIYIKHKWSYCRTLNLKTSIFFGQLLKLTTYFQVHQIGHCYSKWGTNRDRSYCLPPVNCRCSLSELCRISRKFSAWTMMGSYVFNPQRLWMVWNSTDRPSEKKTTKKVDHIRYLLFLLSW